MNFQRSGFVTHPAPRCPHQWADSHAANGEAVNAVGFDIYPIFPVK